ncbi:MAG: ATP-binding protein [Sphingomicrobium sp.]
MDARSGSSIKMTEQSPRLRTLFANSRFEHFAMVGAAVMLGAVALFSAWLLQRDAQPGSFLPPLTIALLLVSNLIPAVVLMVLYSRKVAMARAARGGLGSGRLHTRLVALFSAIAAVPTVLVVVFASLLLQSGLEFWFSDRARGMLENTVQVARAAYDREVERVAAETLAASGDLSHYLKEITIDDPRFPEAFGRIQVLNRNLSEAVILTYGADRQIRSLALVSPYDRVLERDIPPARIAELTGPENVISIVSSDRIGALTRLDYGPNTYLYAARVFDPQLRDQQNRANQILKDYQDLKARSRKNQLRFNAALLVGALVIVALAIIAALKLADRLVRPMGQLITAAGRVEEGDFAARVQVPKSEDEIQTLATAFNRMTGRIEEQTGALKAVNTQLDTRRAFIEAVLSSVTAGVIALDTDGGILLINRSAETLLQKGAQELEGMILKDVSSDLGDFIHGGAPDAEVVIAAGSGQRTLAVKRVRYEDGAVLTFDDITDQLSDQRRAAWSDIARRIAHEIKNPLTPIQLAAERLQRRFGAEIQSDKETFERLTSTIVRQVGDLRRMVDEFSNFARMPKPVFREADVHEIARQSLFLHEVAHPATTFILEPAAGSFPLVCDRRQLSQALTNVVKNAVEAIEARRNRGEHNFGGDRVELRLRRDEGLLILDLMDTGVGLPEERDRLTEPYMTTRVRGTGLGLAIVKKIVEEHRGEIAFLDRPGGGTHVRIMFDADELAEFATTEDEPIESPLDDETEDRRSPFNGA